MGTLRILVIFSFLVLISGVNEAQTYVMVQGSVYNLKGELLVGAHARNLSRGYGTFTDYSGRFSLVLAQNDTLKVSMIGYKPFFLKIPDKLNSLNYSLKVTLLADTIIISGPEIRPYPATYPEFRKEFIALRTPEEIMHKKLGLPLAPFRKRYENPGGGLLLPGPISLLYNTFSKEAKQLKKMEAIYKKDNLRASFLKIISEEILYLRYGCKNDEDIDELIAYCGIDETYLNNVPSYFIAQYLDKCGNEWKSSKSGR
ncbi:MAG: hypothetical protein RBS07_05045 [Lentimicrobium sp.]|jgi:hypothetical protein|nr:hypothetical protein [Lentimicrobium sp.]